VAAEPVPVLVRNCLDVVELPASLESVPPVPAIKISPTVVRGESASKAALAVVDPVPPLAIATVPEMLFAVPFTLPVRFAVMVPAEKLPDASRLTIVEAVLALVAAVVASTEIPIFADVLPPTVPTVGLG
jgi:hypothetical protein